MRVMPNYNVMGVAKAALEASVRYLAADFGERNIRVNAISAGPVRTLAGAGVSDARLMFNYQRDNAPLRRAITIEDIGGAALYLLSDLVARRDRRNPLCRFRLQHRRHAPPRHAEVAGREGRRATPPSRFRPRTAANCGDSRQNKGNLYRKRAS